MTPPTDRPSDVPSQDAQTLDTLNRAVPLTDQPHVETLVPSPTSATMPAAPEERPSLAGYEILGELGRGGMGVVYKARQQGLGRLVALKMILHADHASTEDRLRFLREAETLAQLRHENIVQVHEVGEHDGKPFMCLEYVEGGGLDRHLGGTPLPPRQAAALVEKLAAAMQTAHAAGIVHRDLKPANVLLASGVALALRDEPGRVDLGEPGRVDLGEPGRVSAGSASRGADATPLALKPKITDFGLAKKQDAAGLSASGAVLGTPSYMAPEQAQGKEIDPRADVYALGAILYECLTGRPPFRAATMMDTLMQVIAEEPVPPCQLNPGLPRDLETICLKCLRKEPVQRYASAAALAADLARFQRGEPVLARSVSLLERGWRWTRRNPMVASLLALVLLLMGLGTGIAWILAVRSDGEATEAKAARLTAEKAREDETAAREQADRNLYFSRIALARREWEAGNIQNARDHLDATPPKMRHWEYGYLYGLMYNPEQTFRGHTGMVTTVAVTADGNRIVSGSEDGTVKVWDAQTGQVALTLTGHTGGVTSVVAMPDGTRIVSGGFDDTVRVWDARTGQEVLTLKGHTNTVLSVAVSPDGKHIVSGSGDLTVKVWDAHTGRESHTLKGHEHWVNSVAVTADSKRIVSGSNDCTVKVWDAQTGQQALTLKGHTDSVQSVAVTADGTRIVSGSMDKTVKVWDSQAGHEALTLKGHTERVLSVALTADGTRIVSGSEDMTVKVWDAQTGEVYLTLKGHTGVVRSVAVMPDGIRIVSGSADLTVKVWDAHSGQETLTFKGHASEVDSVSVTADGKRIVSGSGDGTVKVWDAQTGQEALTLTGHTRAVLSVAVTADGTRIVSGSLDGTVKVWDARTGQVALTLKGHTQPIYSVAVTADGARIVSGSGDGTVKVWDARTGQEALALPRNGC